MDFLETETASIPNLFNRDSKYFMIFFNDMRNLNVLKPTGLKPTGKG